MKLAIKLFAILLLLAGLAAAQTPPAAPPSNNAISAEPNQGAHVEVNTSYAKLTDGSNLTILSARIPFSDRWSAVYSQYQIPSAKAQVYLGQAEFREKLSHIFKSKGSNVNLDAIQVFARAGIGTKRDDVGNNPTLAWGFHGGGEIAVGQVAGGTLGVGFSVGYLGISNQGKVKRYVFGNSPEIAPGVFVRF